MDRRSAIMGAMGTTRRLREALLVAVGASALTIGGGMGGGCGSDDTTSTGGGTDASSSDGAQAADQAAGGHDAQGGSDAQSTTDAPFDAGDASPTVRRPFLVGASMRSSRATPRRDWGDRATGAALHDLDPATARSLARVWLADALEEHASVAAFARFTLYLLAVGAPPELVAASQRASLDEIEHARGCFALARRYGAAESGPSALRIDDAVRPSSLAEIVALTAEEGCVGETLGALLAREQLETVSDATASAFLRRLARDEERHAALAWRFVAWAVARGGDEVRTAARDALARASKATLDAEVRPLASGVDAAAWRAHGRLTCAEARAVAARGIAEIVAPCAEALAIA